MDHPKDHSLFGLGLPGLRIDRLQIETPRLTCLMATLGSMVRWEGTSFNEVG